MHAFQPFCSPLQVTLVYIALVCAYLSAIGMSEGRGIANIVELT
jgi:hypothetical protein